MKIKKIFKKEQIIKVIMIISSLVLIIASLAPMFLMMGN